MKTARIERKLKYFEKKGSFREVGSSLLKHTFKFFPNRSFEILDEEILELIVKDPSHQFLFEKEEDVYTLKDGTAI